LPDGWKSEFEEDAWYEQIPLDDQGHFNSIKTTIELIEMWEGIQKDQKDDCYWKRGFIPFLSYQSWGHSVIDTVGYFGGEKGQIIGFDYKCADGYRVEFKGLKTWLETQIELLEKDIYFVRESYVKTERHAKILFEKDRESKAKFPDIIPLRNS
jgi:hypothetical protein